jgi:hypothetical protein
VFCRENALEALDHGILSTLNEITINIANDEELTELIVKSNIHIF